MGMQAGAWQYRVRQFSKALREGRDLVPRAVLDRHLHEDGIRLFRSMSGRDQVHSIRTAELVAQRAPDDEEMIVAALLHDAGKGRQTLWQRAIYVLALGVAPSWLHSFARPGRDTLGALYRSLRHPILGAELAAAAGCSERVCSLIARHHSIDHDENVRLLQRADDIA
jgi:putative nucleotidyltransferase with HDIG domain